MTNLRSITPEEVEHAVGHLAAQLALHNPEAADICAPGVLDDALRAGILWGFVEALQRLDAVLVDDDEECEECEACEACEEGDAYAHARALIDQAEKNGSDLEVYVTH